MFPFPLTLMGVSIVVAFFFPSSHSFFAPALLIVRLIFAVSDPDGSELTGGIQVSLRAADGS